MQFRIGKIQFKIEFWEIELRTLPSVDLYGDYLWTLAINDSCNFN